MVSLPFHRLLTGKTVPLAVIALGIAANASAYDQNQLTMPRTYAVHEDAAGEPAALHTDLGVMGEVELIRERYPDGLIKIERQVTLDRDGNYVNHGAWKFFSSKGDVMAEGQFHFGRRVGLWTRWHDRNDSAIFNEFPYNQFKAPYMSQANFADGEMDGVWILTDASDRKMNQISLKAGKRHGMAITWLANGKVYRQATFDRGVPTGDLLEADKRTGELERVATYVDGRRIITHTTHYPGNRQKHTEIMYLAAETAEESADDYWNVRFAKYTSEGEDLRHGVAKAWYPNGKMEQEGIYQLGQKNGSFTYWHENGQVAATGEFLNDMPVGTWVWWHENGQKSALGKYEQGVLMGEWRWWSEGGKLTRQHVYDGSVSVTSQAEDTFEVGQLPEDDEVNSIF